MLWIRLGWFFEDVWRWLKRTTDLTTRHNEEEFIGEEIYENMNIILHDNPLRNEIKQNESMNEYEQLSVFYHSIFRQIQQL